MSLSSIIKSKEAKAKQKAFPKLKTILASPYKSKYDVISNVDFGNLTDGLNEQITKSGLEPRAFAISQNINIGLESVLRIINNSLVSSVFLALNIKPRHVVNLIARYVELKSPQARVYVVPELEKYAEQIFGIRALAFTFPAETFTLGEKIHKWIAQQQKPVKTIVQKHYKGESKPNFMISNIGSNAKSMNSKIDKQVIDESSANGKIMSSLTQDRDFHSDFISLNGSANNAMEKNNFNLESEKTLLLGVLNKITKQVDSKLNKTTVPINKEIYENDTDMLDMNKATELSKSDLDNFLDYQPLQVHKIRPNLDKKPRTKRKRKNRNAV